jgi:hypothetical protein
MRERWGGRVLFCGALLLYGIPDFSDDIRSLRRAMQIASKADIKSSCNAATWHQRDDHRLDGYQSSS